MKRDHEKKTMNTLAKKEKNCFIIFARHMHRSCSEDVSLGVRCGPGGNVFRSDPTAATNCGVAR